MVDRSEHGIRAVEVVHMPMEVHLNQYKQFTIEINSLLTVGIEQRQEQTAAVSGQNFTVNLFLDK